MILRRAGSCRTHRAALLDFLETRDRTAAAAALEHLDRCRACEDELAAEARVIVALRRLGDDAAAAEPSADAWPRLRARIVASSPVRWLWPAKIGGMVSATMLVAVLVAPLAFGGPVVRSDAVVPLPPPAPMPAQEGDVGIEAAVVAAMRREAQRVTSTSPSAGRPSDSALRIYPDGIAPERKEVESTKAGGQPPAAI